MPRSDLSSVWLVLPVTFVVLTSSDGSACVCACVCMKLISAEKEILAGSGFLSVSAARAS